MEVKILKQDLPQDLNLGKTIAVDTETMGLDFLRDRLCLVQISTEDDKIYIIQIDKKNLKAKNLKKILEDSKIKKIFHYARFDLAVLRKHLDINVKNIFCTKLASRIARTYSDKHGLRDLCKELLNIEINKTMQSSDWGAEELTKEQIQYATSDVLYLHKIKKILDKILMREKRTQISEFCFNFLEHRVTLDLMGWNNQDLFTH